MFLWQPYFTKRNTKAIHAVANGRRTGFEAEKKHYLQNHGWGTCRSSHSKTWEKEGVEKEREDDNQLTDAHPSC